MFYFIVSIQPLAATFQ